MVLDTEAGNSRLFRREETRDIKSMVKPLKLDTGGVVPYSLGNKQSTYSMDIASGGQYWLTAAAAAAAAVVLACGDSSQVDGCSPVLRPYAAACRTQKFRAQHAGNHDVVFVRSRHQLRFLVLLP